MSEDVEKSENSGSMVSKSKTLGKSISMFFQYNDCGENLVGVFVIGSLF